MENNVTKKSWPPYLILGLISLIAALILALTNAITAGPIAEHKMAALQETFSAVMPAASYEEVSFSSSAYSNVSSIYAAKDENGNIIGYCVTASQQGYAGPVAVTFGMDPAGSVVATKVGDTDFQETTGIGAKALNPEFAEQFTGLNATPNVTSSYSRALYNLVAETTPIPTRLSQKLASIPTFKRAEAILAKPLPALCIFTPFSRPFRFSPTALIKLSVEKSLLGS